MNKDNAIYTMLKRYTANQVADMFGITVAQVIEASNRYERTRALEQINLGRGFKFPS